MYWIRHRWAWTNTPTYFTPTLFEQLLQGVKLSLVGFQGDQPFLDVTHQTGVRAHRRVSCQYHSSALTSTPPAGRSGDRNLIASAHFITKPLSLVLASVRDKVFILGFHLYDHNSGQINSAVLELQYISLWHIKNIPHHARKRW
jgi:hypothetical protein